MEAHVYPAPAPASPSSLVPLRLSGEERLARLVGLGNDAAFTVLYQRFHQPLYRYCRSLVGNDADAQDALQTTFTRALIALRAGRRDAPLRPWLFRIAHNESISLLRRRRPEQELAADSGSTAPSPHDVAEERARLRLLLSDLGALPERQRGALVMRELSGLSHEEVAQALGISVGAAKQTVLEARRSLQEFSAGRGMSCEQIQQIVSDGDRRALRGRRVRAHLRECRGCAAFAEAISTRRRDLLALAPALPPAAASGLLAKITGMSSGHGGGGLGASAGATGKGLGAAFSAKSLATGAVVLTTAAVGAGTLHHLTMRHTASPATARAPHRPPAAPPAEVSHLSPSAEHRAAGATAGSRHPVVVGRGRTRDRTVRARSQEPHRAAVSLVRADGSTHGTANRASRGASATAPGHTQSAGASSTAPGHTHSHGDSAAAPGHTKSTTAQTHSASATAPGHTQSTTAQTHGASTIAAGHTRHPAPASTSLPHSTGHGASPNVASAATGSSNVAVVTTTTQSITAPGHSGH